MIVQPTDFAKSRVLTEDFSVLLAHLWRGGDDGYFWQSSLLRYSVTEVEQIGKKGVRKGQNKVTITSWVDLSQPLPSIFPPRSFRARFHNLSYRTIKGRLITPDNPHFLQLYFGVNRVCPKPSHLRKAKYGTRGQKSTMQAVNAFIGDLDVKDFNGDWQAMRDYVETGFLLPPEAIINTGREGRQERATKRTKSAKPTYCTCYRQLLIAPFWHPRSRPPPDVSKLPYFTRHASVVPQQAKIDWHLQDFNHDDYHDWKLVGLALSDESDGS